MSFETSRWVPLLLALAPLGCIGGQSVDPPPAQPPAPPPDAGTGSPDAAAADASEVEPTPIDGGVLNLDLTHGAASPFAVGLGPVAFATEEIALVATATGVEAFRTSGAMPGQPPAGFQEWALTSTGAGAAAGAIAVPPSGALPGLIALFLPAGRPQ